MKKIRICFFIIIILLTSLCIYLYRYVPEDESSNIIFNYVGKEDLPKNQVYPNNFSEFYFMYDGLVISNNIYTELYNIAVIGIPDIYNNMRNSDNVEIGYLYETNENINRFIEKENLEQLLHIFNNIELKKIKYKNCEIVKDSCAKYSNRTEFVLNITYEYNVEIKFKVIVYNNPSSNINFIPIVEE